jgi:hypothetical protein
VAAVSRNPNQLDLFASGPNGRVYTSWWTAGSDWSGLGDKWRDVGGVFPVGAPVSAVSRNPNQLDLFICGNDGRVYTSWWTAGSDWSGLGDNWRNIGGIFPAGAPVAAVSRNPNQLDLFICGNDGRVYTSWWTAGSDWSGLGDNWRNIGGIFPAGALVAAVSRNPNQLDLFICGNDGRVYTSWWTAGSDWSGLGDNWRNIGAPIATLTAQPQSNQLGYDVNYAGHSFPNGVRVDLRLAGLTGHTAPLWVAGATADNNGDISGAFSFLCTSHFPSDATLQVEDQQGPYIIASTPVNFNCTP